MTKLAKTQYPIFDLLQRRWSPRAFSETPIDPKIITRLFEAARWAASSRNDQPWRFIVASSEDIQVHQQMFDCLRPGNQKWAGNAPLLAIVLAPRHYSFTDEPNPIAYYDTGQAVANLVVEAMAHGLYCHQMGGIDRDKIQALYAVPEPYQPVVAIAIGYLGEAADLPEDLQDRELSERVRKPLSEIVFKGAWGAPAELA